MSLFVKVCGVTDIETARTCVEAGVDAIGFVFARSPRRISPQLAHDIANDVAGEVKVVAVFRKPDPAEIRFVDQVLAPDLIQADEGSLASLPLDRRLPVLRQGDAHSVPSGLFLYEGAVSGMGQTVDLSTAAAIATCGEMVLAGGLSPANVSEAIEVVQPAGVDVSSGVELAPGVKDQGLIRDFVAAARSDLHTGAGI